MWFLIVDEGNSIQTKWSSGESIRNMEIARAWRKLLKQRTAVRSYIQHQIGNGCTTSLWFDSWLPGGSIRVNLIFSTKLVAAVQLLYGLILGSLVAQ